jgi:hypothetical protein
MSPAWPVEGTAMASTPKYQIAFEFQFKQNVSNEILQIDITDQNNFVIAAKEALQLGPYAGSATPPLSNMSVTSTSLFLNVSSGNSGQGVEVIVWTTFAGDAPLQITLAANGSVAAYYSVLGGTNSGQLNPGPNTISPNGNGGGRG